MRAQQGKLGEGNGKKPWSRKCDCWQASARSTQSQPILNQHVESLRIILVDNYCRLPLTRVPVRVATWKLSLDSPVPDKSIFKSRKNKLPPKALTRQQLLRLAPTSLLHQPSDLSQASSSSPGLGKTSGSHRRRQVQKPGNGTDIRLQTRMTTVPADNQKRPYTCSTHATGNTCVWKPFCFQTCSKQKKLSAPPGQNKLRRARAASKARFVRQSSALATPAPRWIRRICKYKSRRRSAELVVSASVRTPGGSPALAFAAGLPFGFALALPLALATRR